MFRSDIRVRKLFRLLLVERMETRLLLASDFGDAPLPYPVAEHNATGALLGFLRDTEAVGVPSAGADSDDLSGSDDEDGITFGSMTVGQIGASINVQATGAGRLDGWIDFDQDGVWNNSEERIFTARSIGGFQVLSFNVPNGAASGTTYARFRFSSSGSLPPGGLANNGEVEDYLVTIQPPQTDFGDAPFPYPLANASHAVPGPTLGSLRDSEVTGFHSIAADWDDNNGTDDEDGVLFSPMYVGQLDANLSVQVTGSTGVLDAWIDFDQDGSWNGPGEQIYSGRTLTLGLNLLTFDIPAQAASGYTYARFRISTSGGLGPGEAANDGEIEDYLIAIQPPQAGAGGFSLPPFISSGITHSLGLSAKDIDGDGDTDLVASSINDTTIVWYENTNGATPSFLPHTITNTFGAYDLEIVDLDADGDQDIMAAVSSAGRVAWFENNGAQTFIEHTLTFAAFGVTDIDFLDFDGDGDVDFVAALETTNTLALFLNDGSEAFTQQNVSITATSVRAVVPRDLDGDGDLDLVSSWDAVGTVAWHENNGSLGFAQHLISSTLGEANSIDAADFDGDSDVDLLVDKGVFFNNGHEEFTYQPLSSGGGVWETNAVDFDGDGDFDVVASRGFSQNSMWFENNGFGEFVQSDLPTQSDNRFVAADLDGDQDLDLLSAGLGGVRWIENQSGQIEPTATALVGNGADEFLLQRIGNSLELRDVRLGLPLLTQPIELVNSLTLVGSASEAESLVVDYQSGGHFSIPAGVHFNAQNGSPIDDLTIIGNGLTESQFHSAGISMGNASVTTIEFGQPNLIEFTGIEPLNILSVGTSNVQGSLFVTDQPLVIDAQTFTMLDTVTSLTGGSITAYGGLHLGAGGLISGYGQILAPLHSEQGSTISATGALTLGDVNSFDGIDLLGRLQVHQHTVTLQDGHKAVLGSQTTVGQGEFPGTLDSPNGIELPDTRTLSGHGVIKTSNGEFENQGYVNCSGSTGLTFEDFVTGAGDFGDDGGAGCVFLGGTGFGNSPASIETGTITFGSTNTHTVEIGGLVAGSEFDQVNASGSIHLDGQLEVLLIDLGNGYLPTVGDSFEILRSTEGIYGQFAAVDLPASPFGTGWHLNYELNAVHLVLVELATLESVQFGDGTSQRSNVNQVSLTFSGAVDIDVGAFTLRKRGTAGGEVETNFTTILSGGNTIATLTFSGGFTRGSLNALVDGNYELVIHSTLVLRAGTQLQLDGNGDGLAGGNFLIGSQAIDGFFAWFGDSNGDRFIDFADYGAFGSVFGGSSAIFDFNGDGFIDFADYAAFGARFGGFLNFE
ncbi:MAG: VCBS repeat-containing protein [Planctomycetales bacterium]|nr:VCBS repeat-containing protein [Planctomycetales bacterium]